MSRKREPKVLEPKVLEFAAAASRAPRRSRVVPQGRKAQAAELVPLDDILFSEVEGNSGLNAFTDEEVDRMARVFGLSADEVSALYRSQR